MSDDDDRYRLARRIDELAERVEALEDRAARWPHGGDVEESRARAALIAVGEMRWPDFGESDTARMDVLREQLRLGDEQARRQYHAVRRAISRCVP